MDNAGGDGMSLTVSMCLYVQAKLTMASTQGSFADMGFDPDISRSFHSNTFIDATIAYIL